RGSAPSCVNSGQASESTRLYLGSERARWFARAYLNFGRTLRSARFLFLLLLPGVDSGAQHLGVYHWAGEVPSLSRATAALSRFQFDTIRIFLGGKYDYVHAENSPARFQARRARKLTLAGIAAMP